MAKSLIKVIKILIKTVVKATLRIIDQTSVAACELIRQPLSLAAPTPFRILIILIFIIVIVTIIIIIIVLPVSSWLSLSSLYYYPHYHHLMINDNIFVNIIVTIASLYILNLCLLDSNADDTCRYLKIPFQLLLVMIKL